MAAREEGKYGIVCGESASYSSGVCGRSEEVNQRLHRTTNTQQADEPHARVGQAFSQGKDA